QAQTNTQAQTTTGNLTGMETSGLGFDACTAPSEATMKAWLASPYRVIGTYLGGVNWACSYGNFTADWARQVASEGWRFIPIWVGEQASCSTIQGAALINPADAAAEGTAEAASAVSTAESFGYGPGSTLYYDMEGYNNSNKTCSTGVLTFLSAWTQGLHAAGYQSGVYSSAGSGITDLAAQYGGTTYTSPDDIWAADWDGNPVLSDPYVPDADWANGQRLRQYAGGHNETWGGATINIDSDVIGAPVSGLPGARLDRGPSSLDGTDAVTVAPGGIGTVRLTVGGAAGERWHVTAPSGLTVWPGSGVVFPGRGHAATVRLIVHADASLATGRYDVPVTFSMGDKTVAETFELVSVTQPGTAIATAHPVVLYAADSASMASAVAVARDDALPAADVTGDYSQAWSDLEGGKDIVIAVGTAAVDGLCQNACGWANPDGLPANETPFYWLGTPFSAPPGADVYVPADGTTAANSALLAAQLTHFALAGTLPDYGRPPTLLPRPTDTCLGSANVPVP
ncbi:MAG: glycoside hydrolase domain-containing protein, partial [Trebonia sp.]